MKEVISKELLSEVLDENVLKSGSFNTPILEDHIQKYNYEDWQKFNIHELAHKCKEWAIKDGFHLVSHTISYEAVKQKGYCQTHHVHHKSRESDKPFHADTEPEAIFKATQYIYDNKSKL